MPKPRVFLAYPFKFPEIEVAVRGAVAEFADVIVAKDEVHGSHILDKILRQMNESDICLFDLTDSNVNVVLELGIAIGRASAYCVLRNVSPGHETADADFFSDLKGWDHLRYADTNDLTQKLGEYLPKQLRRAASATKATQMTVPISTYESEAAETLRDAASRSGFLILSYVCSMSLIVHPSSYLGDRFTEDQERNAVDSARQRTGVGFPITGPEKAVNLEDGFQVSTVLLRDGNRPEYREYYRLRRDGLFVLTRVSPDDIGDDRQYRDMDRFIGFVTLVATLTKMMLFAAALACEYNDQTTASVRVCGLAHHKLVDDLADRPLILGDIQVAYQDVVTAAFSGSPEEFEKEKNEWAVDAIAKCLRALNYPAVTDSIKTVVRQYQKRVC